MFGFYSVLGKQHTGRVAFSERRSGRVRVKLLRPRDMVDPQWEHQVPAGRTGEQQLAGGIPLRAHSRYPPKTAQTMERSRLCTFSIPDDSCVH